MPHPGFRFVGLNPFENQVYFYHHWEVLEQEELQLS